MSHLSYLIYLDGSLKTVSWSADPDWLMILGGKVDSLLVYILSYHSSEPHHKVKYNSNVLLIYGLRCAASTITLTLGPLRLGSFRGGVTNC